MDFVAIDIENVLIRCRGSSSKRMPCSIGAVKVVDGKITDEYYTLIQPPNNAYDNFTPKIHHITPSMTKDALPFNEILGTLCQFIGDYPVFCHSAKTAEIPILTDALEYYGLQTPDWSFYCTKEIAKRVGFSRVRLVDIAKYFHMQFNDHHNALEDARICSKVALQLLNEYGVTITQSASVDSGAILSQNVATNIDLDLLQKLEEQSNRVRPFTCSELISVNGEDFDMRITRMKNKKHLVIEISEPSERIYTNNESKVISFEELQENEKAFMYSMTQIYLSCFYGIEIDDEDDEEATETEYFSEIERKYIDFETAHDCFADLKICVSGEGYEYFEDERHGLEQFIQEHQGRLMHNISGQTDYLVLGKTTYKDYINGETSTGKLNKARDLLSSGKGKLKGVLSEEQFIQLAKELSLNTDTDS